MTWLGIADWAEATLTYVGYDGKESLIYLASVFCKAWALPLPTKFKKSAGRGSPALHKSPTL